MMDTWIQAPSGVDMLMDFALALSALLLLVTLIVCWTMSGRNKQ